MPRRFIYNNHKQETSSTLTLTLLLVGGGGAGGEWTGSGGNGGVATGFTYSMSKGSKNITVGIGGVYTGTHTGGNSTFDTLTAAGGNGGNDYGAEIGAQTNSGRGGSNAYPNYRITGGDGFSSSISGSEYKYGAGGGAGGNYSSGNGTNAGGGGTTGGGAGSKIGNGANATGIGAGGGGGGLPYTPTTQHGGNGYSGIVIVRYTAASQICSGGSVTTSGGDYIHTFTSNGTFTYN